jgi:hypothetical protein
LAFTHFYNFFWNEYIIQFGRQSSKDFIENLQQLAKQRLIEKRIEV